jgi:hypothetical protein
MTVALPPEPPIRAPQKSLGLGLLLLALLAGVVGIQRGELQQLRTHKTAWTDGELQRDVADRGNRINLLGKLPSFGFDNAIAGAMLLDFAQYFGDVPARDRQGYGLGLDYLDLVLAKDPKFTHAYYYLSVVGSVYVAQPEKSVAIMNRGFQSIGLRSPQDSYYLWRMKGTDELLFLGNPQAAQKSMATAANWAEQIGDTESLRVARMSKATAQFLAHNPNSKIAQFASWMMVLDNAVDERARTVAMEKVRALGGKIEVDAQGKLRVTPPPKD